MEEETVQTEEEQAPEEEAKCSKCGGPLDAEGKCSNCDEGVTEEVQETEGAQETEEAEETPTE